MSFDAMTIRERIKARKARRENALLIFLGLCAGASIGSVAWLFTHGVPL